jgi:putative transposase
VKCINIYLEQLKIKYKDLILALNKDDKKEYKVKKENIEKEQKFIEEEIEKFKKENFSLMKNPLIYDFELNTSNEIKSNAIKSVCDAYKSGFSNLRNGTIKYFNMKFKKKNEKRKCIELAKSDIQFFKSGVKISPSKFQNGEEIIKINKKNLNKYKDLKITHNTDLTKVNGIYYIHVLVDYKIKQEENKKYLNFCGIDPGVRTFVSIYGNNDISTIDMKDPNKLKRLNNKIKFLKTLRIRKKKIIKIEKRKEYIIDEMHWNICNYLIKSYDVIFFGDIKSHNIVKKSYNKTLNRKFNDLKFYKFKKRLLYKGIMNNKKVFFINEAFTSQGCSTCGNLWKELGKNKIYTCQNKLCKKVFDRDYNAAKNICMKGILLNN